MQIYNDSVLTSKKKRNRREKVKTVVHYNTIAMMTAVAAIAMAKKKIVKK